MGPGLELFVAVIGLGGLGQWALHETAPSLWARASDEGGRDGH